MSERHFQRSVEFGADVGVQFLSTGAVLRVDGFDGSVWSMHSRLLLRRRQLCVYTVQERVVAIVVPCELCGRDLRECEEPDYERHLPSWPLLSAVERGSDPVCGWSQLFVDGSCDCERLSALLARLLLSAERHCVCDSIVFGGILLSDGHRRPDVSAVVAVSSRVDVSSGQLVACALLSWELSRPGWYADMQGVSRGQLLRSEHSDSIGVSCRIELSFWQFHVQRMPSRTFPRPKWHRDMQGVSRGQLLPARHSDPGPMPSRIVLSCWHDERR